jgi:hypothetical protein
MLVKRLAIGASLLVIAACFLTLPDHAIFWSPDEGGKYLDSRQIASSVRLNNTLPYPGRTLDPDLEYIPLLYYFQRGSNLYSWWPSWFPALSAPLYRIFGPRGIFLIPLVSGILVCAIVYHALSDISGKLAGAALCIPILSSPIFFYSLTFWEHIPHTFLVLLACLFAIHGWKQPRFRWHAISGGLLGLALYLRLETVLFAGAVELTGVLLLYQQRCSRQAVEQHIRQLLIFTLCFIVVALPYCAINSYNEGHILGRQYNPEFAPYRTGSFPAALHPGEAEVVPNLIVGTARHNGADLSPTWRWLFVLVTFGSALWPWLHIRKLGNIAIFCVLVLVTLCSTILFEEATYTSLHGLVLSAPWIVLAGWSLCPRMDEPTRRWGYLAGFSCIIFLGASLLRGWEGQGGLQWGPRYALPLYPLLSICVARGIRRAFTNLSSKKLIKMWLVGSLITFCILGIGFELRGLHLMYARKHAYATWERQMKALPQDSVITTDLEWLALTLPEIYATRIMHFADPDDLLNSPWRARAYEADYRQICHIHHPTQVDIQITCRAITKPSSE